jgi:penicillin-binding protein 1A
VPAEMGNSMNSADILLNDLELMPGAEGQDMGVGSEDDYKLETAPYIGPESTPVREEDSKSIPTPKKDTLPKKETDLPRNNPASSEKGDKKKGLLNRILKKNE